jgi:hydroxyethylthiazole kinase
MKNPAALIRTGRPLVHCITNYVTMDWLARGLLAAGARPVMVHAAEEVGGLARVASALLLNQGTWSPDQHQAMSLAAASAREAGVPVVLDPVGAGALPARTAAAMELLERGLVTAIRGNAGEILALSGEPGLTRGVDSAEINPEGRLRRAAIRLARRYNCLVVATGAVDLVTDGQETLLVRGGDPLLTEIPGAGCLGGAILAAFLGAWRSAGASGSLVAGVAALQLWMKVAAELAAPGSGVGTFSDRYLDALAAPITLPADRIRQPLTDLLALNVLLDGQTTPELVDSLLAAGVRSIQFREKKQEMVAQLPVARMIREKCRAAGALFLVNDRVDLALAVDADGVHVGQSDLPVGEVRRILGPGKVVGLSAETPEEAEIGQRAGADYLGVGPIYATTTKADAGEPVGPERIRAVVETVDLPVVGIGGIGLGKVAPVIQAGAVGAAVISAVTAAADPAAAARALLAERNEVWAD